MKWFWRIVGGAMMIGGILGLLRLLRKPRWEQAFRPSTPQPAPVAMPVSTAALPEQQPRSLSLEPAAQPAQPVPAGAPDKDMPDQPPPPPTPERLELFTRGGGNEQAQRLWLTLQREAFRQRAEGFREDWAFPRHAARHDRGFPLAAAQRVRAGNDEYSMQPYTGAILFCPVPRWSEVHDLYDVLKDAPADAGFEQELMQAAFEATGQSYRTDWASHTFSIRERLGPALAPAERITVGGTEYSLQVFAGDTIYVQVPEWANLQRLSDTPAGELADALWRETYKATGCDFDPQRATHQRAVAEKLGTPLGDMYAIDFEGAPLELQVFARDVLFAEPGGDLSRLSALERPETYTAAAAPPASAVFVPPDAFTAADAVSNKRPVFGMLPIAGSPQITQLYGYTTWAAGGGRHFYTACQGQHPGIDFWVPVGTPLLAIAYGLVVYAGPSSAAPFGGSPPMIVIVRYGNLYAIYGHSSQVNVRAGQQVRPGEVVALSGDYGRPHLHFEVRPVPAVLLQNSDVNQPAINPGTTMNPLDYFSDEWQRYFEQAFERLGGDGHFCQGSLRDQAPITFAGPVDTRPCR